MTSPFRIERLDPVVPTPRHMPFLPMHPPTSARTSTSPNALTNTSAPRPRSPGSATKVYGPHRLVKSRSDGSPIKDDGRVEDPLVRRMERAQALVQKELQLLGDITNRHRSPYPSASAPTEEVKGKGKGKDSMVKNGTVDNNASTKGGEKGDGQMPGPAEVRALVRKRLGSASSSKGKGKGKDQAGHKAKGSEKRNGKHGGADGVAGVDDLDDDLRPVPGMQRALSQDELMMKRGRVRSLSGQSLQFQAFAEQKREEAELDTDRLQQSPRFGGTGVYDAGHHVHGGGVSHDYDQGQVYSLAQDSRFQNDSRLVTMQASPKQDASIQTNMPDPGDQKSSAFPQRPELPARTKVTFASANITNSSATTPSSKHSTINKSSRSTTPKPPPATTTATVRRHFRSKDLSKSQPLPSKSTSKKKPDFVVSPVRSAQTTRTGLKARDKQTDGFFENQLVESDKRLIRSFKSLMQEVEQEYAKNARLKAMKRKAVGSRGKGASGMHHRDGHSGGAVVRNLSKPSVTPKASGGGKKSTPPGRVKKPTEIPSRRANASEDCSPISQASPSSEAAPSATNQSINPEMLKDLKRTWLDSELSKFRRVLAESPQFRNATANAPSSSVSNPTIRIHQLQGGATQQAASERSDDSRRNTNPKSSKHFIRGFADDTDDGDDEEITSKSFVDALESNKHLGDIMAESPPHLPSSRDVSFPPHSDGVTTDDEEFDMSDSFGIQQDPITIVKRDRMEPLMSTRSAWKKPASTSGTSVAGKSKSGQELRTSSSAGLDSRIESIIAQKLQPVLSKARDDLERAARRIEATFADGEFSIPSSRASSEKLATTEQREGKGKPEYGGNREDEGTGNRNSKSNNRAGSIPGGTAWRQKNIDKARGGDLVDWAEPKSMRARVSMEQFQKTVGEIIDEGGGPASAEDDDEGSCELMGGFRRQGKERVGFEDAEKETEEKEEQPVKDQQKRGDSDESSEDDGAIIIERPSLRRRDQGGSRSVAVNTTHICEPRDQDVEHLWGEGKGNGADRDNDSDGGNDGEVENAQDDGRPWVDIGLPPSMRNNIIQGREKYMRFVANQLGLPPPQPSGSTTMGVSDHQALMKMGPWEAIDNATSDLLEDIISGIVLEVCRMTDEYVDGLVGDEFRPAPSPTAPPAPPASSAPEDPFAVFGSAPPLELSRF
ncbi:hypothetical protein HK102_004282 [Quaeritorhiza haematococci]|nr:hypothetical protein HK102_004282 [Quaeritorhiza haematococci]